MKLSAPKPNDSRAFYESISELYPTDDRWHRITHQWIASVVNQQFPNGGSLTDQSVLNLGSGGQSFCLPERVVFHVDLNEKGFAEGQRYIVADIQALPDLHRTFEYCICVGSVINHCDAAAVLAGVSRILRPGGSLLLEFESSYSFEFACTRNFRKSAVVVRTRYQNREIHLWMYSPRYIKSLLKTFNFGLRGSIRKHILSPAVYRLWPNANFAARFHLLDGLARFIPVVNWHAHNIIYLCQKLC